MFQAIRRRFNATGLVAVLALVFAMGGGAYAAGRYVVTSTKQIKPSVLAQLKGKAGGVGAQGPAGPAGTQGATGATGAVGAKGETGAQGKEGPPGKNGENGKDGTTGFTSRLPKEQTETGGWSAFITPPSEATIVPISFNIPLPGELEGSQVHVAPNAACPGTAAEPSALPGNLCVYIGHNTSGWGEVLGIGKLAQANPSEANTEPGANSSGAALQIALASGKALALISGTWAVTAPE